MTFLRRSERLAYFAECVCGERIPEGALLHIHNGERAKPVAWWSRPVDEAWRSMTPVDEARAPQYDCPECGGSGEYEDGETCHCCGGSGWVSWDPNEETQK